MQFGVVVSALTDPDPMTAQVSGSIHCQLMRCVALWLFCADPDTSVSVYAVVPGGTHTLLEPVRGTPSMVHDGIGHSPVSGAQVESATMPVIPASTPPIAYEVTWMTSGADVGFCTVKGT